MRKGILLLLLTSILFLFGCGETSDLAVKANDHTTQETEIVTKPTTTSKDKDEPTSDEAKTNETDKNDKKTKEPTKQEKKQSLPHLKVHYIDAGQADATLFQYTYEDEPYTILYDTGDWNRNDVVNYLATQEIDYIDLVIISHPHADHDGQLAQVINTYDVEEVWLSGNKGNSQTFQRGLEAVLASDANYYEPRAGDEFDIGSMGIEILHPQTLTGKLNEDSVSIRFTYGEKVFLFTGDAYKNEEKLMMKQAKTVKADVLQLGHHGSNTSSDPAFIQAVDPKIAIYSASANNSYGHPHEETVSLIQNKGITLYGTDVHGTIIITSDGKSLDVQTKADGTISPTSTGSSNKGNKDKKPKDKPKDKKPTTDCIDINTASIDELQAIIHIGPARAEDVVKHRPYQSVSQLTAVNGIGPARIADIESEGMACVK